MLVFELLSFQRFEVDSYLPVLNAVCLASPCSLLQNLIEDYDVIALLDVFKNPVLCESREMKLFQIAYNSYPR